MRYMRKRIKRLCVCAQVTASNTRYNRARARLLRYDLRVYGGSTGHGIPVWLAATVMRGIWAKADWRRRERGEDCRKRAGANLQHKVQKVKKVGCLFNTGIEARAQGGEHQKNAGACSMQHVQQPEGGGAGATCIKTPSLGRRTAARTCRHWQSELHNT